LKVLKGVWKASSLDKHEPKFQDLVPENTTLEAMAGNSEKKRTWMAG